MTTDVDQCREILRSIVPLVVVAAQPRRCGPVPTGASSSPVSGCRSWGRSSSVGHVMLVSVTWSCSSTSSTPSSGWGSSSSSRPSTTHAEGVGTRVYPGRTSASSPSPPSGSTITGRCGSSCPVALDPAVGAGQGGDHDGAGDDPGRAPRPRPGAGRPGPGPRRGGRPRAGGPGPPPARPGVGRRRRGHGVRGGRRRRGPEAAPRPRRRPRRRGRRRDVHHAAAQRLPARPPHGLPRPERGPAGHRYQTQQVRVAIGSGGWNGQGLFHGTQTQGGFIPFQQTDFVFSVAGRSSGSSARPRSSCCWRSSSCAPRGRWSRRRVRAARRGGRRRVVHGAGGREHRDEPRLTPVTGLPLPFVSYGGSSMFACWLALGLVNAVHIGDSRRRRP